MIKIAIIRYSADVKRCVKDCLLNIFFKKTDLIDFFQNDCGCTSADMRGIIPSLSKSQIVDLLFGNLNNRGDSGNLQLHTIIQNVVRWSDFESYWFKNGSLNAEEAKHDIERLKKMIGEKTKEDESIRELDRRREAVEAAKLKRLNVANLLETFRKLMAMNSEAQQRGYEFEKFLKDLFGFFEIKLDKPFKLTGEQIDGSFRLQGDNSYICEARWKDEPSTTEGLYQFAYKVQTKTLYPRGTFISVNGFSAGAIEAICKNNTPNIFLMDGADLICVLEEIISLPDLLAKKVELGQTRGRIFVPAREIIYG
jgi:hypothetical protein